MTVSPPSRRFLIKFSMWVARSRETCAHPYSAPYVCRRPHSRGTPRCKPKALEGVHLPGGGGALRGHIMHEDSCPYCCMQRGIVHAQRRVWTEAKVCIQ